MSRAKVYSGWTQLALGALAMVAMLPGRTQGLGLVWGRAFGRIHLGRSQGAAQMMTVLASALGPLVLALTS